MFTCLRKKLLISCFPIIKVTSSKKVNQRIYSFTYNQAGRVIEIKINSNAMGRDLFKTISQYTFSYDKDGSIKTIRDIGKNGDIVKEINYEIETIGGK